tara:strand:+ start:885 stop:1175 length:291 start_codon:yes stop_codon:yes gene_type:complete
MNPIDLLTEFGVPISMCVALGYFIWRQQRWIQDDLRKDLEKQAERLENICISLINAQKKLQTDFGKELTRLQGSYHSLTTIIQKLSGNGLSKKKRK